MKTKKGKTTINTDSKKDFPYSKEYNEENRRKRAYQNIYLPNRDKYPLAFSEYKIWYRDGNERNESVDNILLMTAKDYEEALEEINPSDHPTSEIVYGGISKDSKNQLNKKRLSAKSAKKNPEKKEIDRGYALLLVPGIKPYPKTDSEAEAYMKAFKTKLLATIAGLLALVLMFILLSK